LSAFSSVSIGEIPPESGLTSIYPAKIAKAGEGGLKHCGLGWLARPEVVVFPLVGETEILNALQNRSERGLRGHAHSSIRIQEGEPIKNKSLAESGERPKILKIALWQQQWQQSAKFIP
jgi:hypothetical protein